MRLVLQRLIGEAVEVLVGCGRHCPGFDPALGKRRSVAPPDLFRSVPASGSAATGPVRRAGREGAGFVLVDAILSLFLICVALGALASVPLTMMRLLLLETARSDVLSVATYAFDRVEAGISPDQVRREVNGADGAESLLPGCRLDEAVFSEEGPVRRLLLRIGFDGPRGESSLSLSRCLSL